MTTKASTSAASATGFVLKGWHVLTVLLAFFAIVIGVDVAFSVIAMRTFPGEDVKRSYVQGNHYNETLAARARQAKLGWRATAEIAARGGQRAIVVTFHDAAGAPLNDLKVTGGLRRPATADADRLLTFSPAQAGARDGVYVATAPGLAAGVWDLQATAARGGDTFDVRARLTTQDPPQ